MTRIKSQPPNDMAEAVNPEVKEQAPSGRVSRGTLQNITYIVPVTP